MFHRHLDQVSKRYKEHPNVAAMYTSLPKDKAKGSEHFHLPKVRDFAYDQRVSENDTRDFIADFTDFGFRAHHRRVNNGDFLSRAGVLGYEKLEQLQKPSADLKAQFLGFSGKAYQPLQCQERPTSEATTTTTLNSVSSNLSGASATPSTAASGTMEEDNNKRLGFVRDERLLLAVAICMLDDMK